jgi:hypothetical protein
VDLVNLGRRRMAPPVQRRPGAAPRWALGEEARNSDSPRASPYRINSTGHATASGARGTAANQPWPGASWARLSIRTPDRENVHFAKDPPDDHLVFPGDGRDGYLVNGTILKRELYPAMERAGIPRVGPTGEKRTFHSFRHTFARSRSSTAPS